MKQLEKKWNSLANKKRLPEKIHEALMRKYGEQKSVVGRSVWKLVKTVAICLVGMDMSISRAIPKWRLGGTSDLD